ncbi:MAG: hypothetical protein JXQ79_03215 [Rhodobacteraceae bacterium]|nr:hypothetical protein [Paracoccaceae bacterium]
MPPIDLKAALAVNAEAAANVAARGSPKNTSRALPQQQEQIAAARRIMADKTPCNLTQDEMRRIGAKLMEREG